MKFRKKPVIIEAEQFFITDWLKSGRKHLGVYGEPVSGKTNAVQLYINTLEGRHEVSDGDWIITGVKGETYPCKPDIFEMTYEKV